MKPGPRPKQNDVDNRGIVGRNGISVGWLKAQARVINSLLHILRDGSPGYIAKIKDGTSGKLPRESPEVDFVTFHDQLGQPARQRTGLEHSNDKIVEVLVVVTVSPGKEQDARRLIRGNKGYVLTPPDRGQPELWRRLKIARSVSEVQLLAIQIGKIIPTRHWRVLHCHAADFLKAKRLHNYPRSNRPRSDEKRIHFFAKVLSGFMQDIAPATATKRLARLSLPNARDIKKSFEEGVMWLSMPRYRKQNMMKRLVAVERDTGSSEWWNVYQDEKNHTWREPVKKEPSR